MNRLLDAVTDVINNGYAEHEDAQARQDIAETVKVLIPTIYDTIAECHEDPESALKESYRDIWELNRKAIVEALGRYILREQASRWRGR